MRARDCDGATDRSRTSQKDAYHSPAASTESGYRNREAGKKMRGLKKTVRKRASGPGSDGGDSQNRQNPRTVPPRS